MGFWRLLICVAAFLPQYLNAENLEDCFLPECEIENPFFFSSKLLYWKATEDELEYVDKFSVTTPPTAILVEGEVKDLDFTRAPGSQVSIGYAWDLYDLALTWTSLYSHSDASTSAAGFGTEFLKPNWFPFLLGGLADEASADWKFHFNTLDLDFGRSFWIGKNALLHPHVGIRAAWLDQKYQVRYHAAFQYIDGGVTNTFLSNTSLDAMNDFKAIGLRFGLDGQWFFSKNWSLLGGASTSLLYGRFDIMEEINGGLILDFGGGPAFVPEILTLSETLIRPRFDIETLLGLQWETYFSPPKCSLSLALFYEASFWINQNQIINRTIAINNSPINATAINSNSNESILHQKGNIQLTGFSFQVRIDKAF